MLAFEVLRQDEIELVLMLDSEEAFEEVLRFNWRLWCSGEDDRQSLSLRLKRPFCSAAWKASNARLNWVLRLSRFSDFFGVDSIWSGLFDSDWFWQISVVLSINAVTFKIFI